MKKNRISLLIAALFWVALPALWTGCGPVKRCLDNNDCTQGQACTSGLCQPISGGGATCKQDGKTYKPGDSFPSSDGCNTCSCDQQGRIACTLRACVKGCTYEGKKYKEGEKFPAADGCNTCTCSANGTVGCTEKACPKPPPGGCDAKNTCPPNRKCVYKTGVCKPAASDKGECKELSVACTEEYMPVCGCDNKTYSNACHAHSTGATIAKKGKCQTTKDTCEYEGKTYNLGDTYPAKDGCNKCTCTRTGSACTEKACQVACGARLGNTCKGDQYCHIAKGCGWDDGTGFCKPKPQGCTKEYKPVCGCDNKTYGNACSAHAAGASVQHEGECKTSGRACGSRGMKPCDAGDYCDQPKHCGATDIPGVCKKKPQACTEQYAPVCGCDGKTYGNDCKAAGAGVSIKANGECPSTGNGCKYNGKVYKTGDSFPSTDGCNTCTCTESGNVACTKKGCVEHCGGLRGLKCKDSNDYCYIPKGCGWNDATGTCQPKPQGCTKQYAPVCGCDSKTYGNKCMAAAAGVSIQYTGECKKTGCQYNGKTYKQGDTFPSTDGCNTCSCGANGAVACTKKACTNQCGGIRGIKCTKSGEYCAYPSGSCGTNDRTGTCTKKPGACTQQYDPVCGCDNKTYGNACTAASNGMSVAYKGECKKTGCTYNGKTYKQGDTFPSTDGCNTCSCGANGAVACTKKACPKTCGGKMGIKCTGSGEYCAYPDATCNVSDRAGTCQTKPTVCNRLYAPVCGCDGKTYSNSCVAASQGASIAKKGPC